MKALGPNQIRGGNIRKVVLNEEGVTGMLRKKYSEEREDLRNRRITEEDTVIKDIIKENAEWLESESRQKLMLKLGLIGELDNYRMSEDNCGLLFYNGEQEELVLPDIFLHMRYIVHSNTGLCVPRKLVLNKHMRCIRDMALQNSRLKELELNEGLRYIHREALVSNQLKRLVLPSTLEILGVGSLWMAFNDNAQLYVNSDKIGLRDVIDALKGLDTELEVIFKRGREKEIQREINKIIKDEKKRSMKREKGIVREPSVFRMVFNQVGILQRITLRFE